MAVSFLNSFISYLLLFAVCVVVVCVAVKLGMTMRRNKDAKDALTAASDGSADGQVTPGA